LKDNNTLKELKLWLCASLKNSNAQLICESIKENKINDNEIIEMLNEVIEKLQQILFILQQQNETIVINKEKCHKCGGMNENE